MSETIMNLTKVTLASLLLFAASAMGQDGTIHPLDAPPEPNAILLGTGGVENQPSKESWFRQWGEPMVRNVTTATLTPFLPDPAKANGTAVIVAPGGGFRWLSINNEGWKIAKALNERGVAAFVLKYRLQPTPPTLDGQRESMNRTFAAVTPPAGSGAPAAETFEGQRAHDRDQSRDHGPQRTGRRRAVQGQIDACDRRAGEGHGSGDQFADGPVEPSHVGQTTHRPVMCNTVVMRFSTSVDLTGDGRPDRHGFRHRVWAQSRRRCGAGCRRRAFPRRWASSTGRP